MMSSENFAPLLTDDESEQSDNVELPDIPHNPMWLRKILESELNNEETIPGLSRYIQKLCKA